MKGSTFDILQVRDTLVLLFESADSSVAAETLGGILSSVAEECRTAASAQGYNSDEIEIRVEAVSAGCLKVTIRQVKNCTYEAMTFVAVCITLFGHPGDSIKGALEMMKQAAAEEKTESIIQDFEYGIEKSDLPFRLAKHICDDPSITSLGVSVNGLPDDKVFTAPRVSFERFLSVRERERRKKELIDKKSDAEEAVKKANFELAEAKRSLAVSEHNLTKHLVKSSLSESPKILDSN